MMGYKSPSMKCLISFVADQSSNDTCAVIFDYFDRHGCVITIAGKETSV